jgi:prepilin-type N-terminal cleavage/methylation domain-containing protein/prepilin-type processing-associated H-X9-DG protein
VSRTYTRRRGFTLFEVLVVVLIVACLAAILAPALSTVRRKSLLAKCAANQRQLYVGWALYAQENKGRMLQISNGDFDWDRLLFSVLPNTNTGNRRQVSTVYQCPASQCRLGDHWYNSNYGYNEKLGDYTDVSNERIQNYKYLSNLQRANGLVLFADASVWVDFGEGFDSAGNLPRWRNHRSLHNGLIPNADGSEPGKSVGYRWHGGVANFMFADGHGETLSIAEVRRRDREDNPSGDGTIRRLID